MAESAVSFVLEQLSMWLGEERRLLGGVEREVEYIRDEMGQMREFLRVADAKEESNTVLKEWIRQLREISYDVEDVLDIYMLRFGQGHAGNGYIGFIKKAYDSVKLLRARHRMASEIQAIKCRLENVSKSQQRYREMYVVVDELGSSSCSMVPTKNMWCDGRGDALFLEETDVVGIQEPKKQLFEWIRSANVGLEVISVVGMGGLGKTTLVSKVYNDESVKRRFDRHVLIVASDYKDVKHLLASLIKKLVGEVKESPPLELEDMSVDEMRDFIHESLRNDKYIIVLDDVWDVSIWEVIKFALPKRGTRGCIIITTRFLSIANAACCETGHVYDLQPLPVEESRELFYRKAFPRNICPPNHLRDFVENILRRCEGLPLAIVLMGGLLAKKNDRPDEWEKFNRSITHELGDGGSLQRLWMLLSLSYNDLPYYLKSCFLYLSMFPDGGLLNKHCVIGLWMAEGFVIARQDKTMEEVAEEYLNELVSRSLVQVAEQDYNGDVVAIRIHDLVQEYITSKSREHNIVIVYRGGQEMQCPNKTRRLMIQESIPFSMETHNFECLRSLVLTCGGNQVACGAIKELVKRCRLLNVLDLGRAPLEVIPDEVFRLHHLKYLCLSNSNVNHIPRSIKHLEVLETLELINSNVTELPNEILKLRRLRRLLIYNDKNRFTFHSTQGVKVPCSIGDCLLSLQELYYIDVDGIKIAREIGKLKQLRILGVVNLRSEDGKEFSSSVAKLTNLRWLSICSTEKGDKLDLDYPLTGLPFLRTLVLRGCLEKLPQWISSLNCLSVVNLRWSRLREDPLDILQDLPNLTNLNIHDAYVEGLRFKAHGFRKLKELWLKEFNCLKWVVVEKGSMHVLLKWIMRDCQLLTEMPQGIEHLTNVEVLDFGNMANEFVERSVEERRKEGGNWRLARVHNVRFFHVIGSEWKRLQVWGVTNCTPP